MQHSTTAATCGECGGKYHPAAGPCIHEHPAQETHEQRMARYDAALAETGAFLEQIRPRFAITCGDCGREWTPGHYCCIARAASEEMNAMVRAVQPEEQPYEPTAQERKEEEAEAADLAACDQFGALAGKLWREGKVTYLAYEQMLDAYALAVVAIRAADVLGAFDATASRNRKSDQVQEPESYEAL